MLTRRRKTKTETQILTTPTVETYTLLMITKMGAQVPIGRNGLFQVFHDWVEASRAIAHAVNVQMPHGLVGTVADGSDATQLIETIIVTVTQTRADKLLVLNTARLDHGEIAAICDGKANIPDVVGRNLRVRVPSPK